MRSPAALATTPIRFFLIALCAGWADSLATGCGSSPGRWLASRYGRRRGHRTRRSPAPAGRVRPEVVWAALDCPSGIAAADAAGLARDTVILLGRMTASLAGCLQPATTAW